MKNQECKYCYGKGYASRMYHEIGFPDFIGDKGWMDLKQEKVICQCQKDPIAEARKSPMFKWYLLLAKIRIRLGLWLHRQAERILNTKCE